MLEQRTEMLRALVLGEVQLGEQLTALAWKLLDAPKEERA